MIQVRCSIWLTEFTGDLVQGNCCPFEGVMIVMFRSWSLAVQILARERLEALCGELKFQTGNRPVTLATMRKHQLVEAAVTQLLWSRERAERETVGELRLAFAGTPTRGGRVSARAKETATSRLEKVSSRRIKGLGDGTEHPSLVGPDGKAKVKEALIRELLRWCERHPEMEGSPFGAEAAHVPVDATIGSAQSRINSGDADWLRRERTSL